MSLIPIDAARNHCKADAADDGMLTLYLASAERASMRRANRNLYIDQTALDAAIAAIPAKMTTAFTTYDVDMNAAALIEVENDRLVAEAIAKRKLQNAKLDQFYTVNGAVADDDVIGAILLILGHNYRNREAIVTGQGAAAVEIPMGAGYVLDMIRVDSE